MRAAEEGAAVGRPKGGGKQKGGAGGGPGSLDVNALPAQLASTSEATQNFNERSVSDAKARFADVLAQTVEKKEAQLGFELEPDMVKDLEKILRVRYCGPDGLIGPC